MPDGQRSAAQYWGEGEDIQVEGENIWDSCRGARWSIDPSLIGDSPISVAALSQVVTVFASTLPPVAASVLVPHVATREFRVLFPAHTEFPQPKTGPKHSPYTCEIDLRAARHMLDIAVVP